MNILTSCFGIVSLFTVLLPIEGDSDCILISDSDHQVTSKDFRVTSTHGKYIMCGAYFCSHFPAVLPLELLIHEINSTKDNLAVYLEKKSITPINNCGHCQSAVLQDNTAEEKNTCKPCPHLEPSKTVDLYVRLEKPSNFDASSEECVWNVNFNMSVQEYTCKKGLPVNIPQAKHCNVSTLSGSDLQCIVPTCSEDIIVKADVDNFIHTFIPTNKSEVCIWELHVDPSNTIDLVFPPLIKNYITIFEDSLLRPKWSVNDCSFISDNIKIQSNFRKIFVLYNNNEVLTSEAFLQVNITQAGCSLPRSIENGYVEFKVSPNGTFAQYSCFENYQLVGSEIVYCDKEVSPPVCTEDKEFLFMADGPANPNISEHFANSVANTSKFKSLRYNLNVSVVDPSRSPDPSLQNKSLLQLDTLVTRKTKGQNELTESETARSNISLIELDQGNSETAKSTTETISTTALTEGSGHSRLEDENGFSDMVDSEQNLESGTLVTVNPVDNISVPLTNVSLNHSYGSPWSPSEGGIILFSLPALEDKMLLFIIIGSGVLLVVIITVISLIICRNRSVRSGLNRKFDTFQNPIYEKPVVRVPIPNSDSDPSHEKLDLGDLSDSTVLD